MLPRREEYSQTQIFSLADWRKHTDASTHTSCEPSMPSRGTLTRRKLPLEMWSAPKKSIRTVRFCTGEGSGSSEGDHSRSLPYLYSPSWTKCKAGWRARVLSRRTVREVSKGTPLDVIVGPWQKHCWWRYHRWNLWESLRGKRNSWQMLRDDSVFKNSRRGSHMVPRKRRVHNSLQQSALNFQRKKKSQKQVHVPNLR